MNPRIALLILALSIAPACHAGILSFCKPSLNFCKTKIVEQWQYLKSRDFFTNCFSAGLNQAKDSTYTFFSVPFNNDAYTKNKKANVLKDFKNNLQKKLIPLQPRCIHENFKIFVIKKSLIDEIRELPLTTEQKVLIVQNINTYNTFLGSSMSLIQPYYGDKKRYNLLIQALREKISTAQAANPDAEWVHVLTRIQKKLNKTNISEKLIAEVGRIPESDPLLQDVNLYNLSHQKIKDLQQRHTEAVRQAQALVDLIDTFIEEVTYKPTPADHLKATIIVGGATIALITALVKLRGTHEYAQ